MAPTTDTYLLQLEANDMAVLSLNGSEVLAIHIDNIFAQGA